MNKLKTLTLACCAVAGLAAAKASERPLWLRYPSISPNGKEIAFTYRGDIYKVDSKGGNAIRLTTNVAYDSRPIWSPDGERIAFTSDRNRLGTNIYIMSAQGGEAKLLTTHSGTEEPYSFTPDGKYILFRAGIQDDHKSTLYPGHNQPELYRVSIAGNARPERILGMPAEYAVMSSDGKRILYHNLKGAENEWRKHHTSSITRDIVEYDVANQTFRYVVQHPGEDRNPLYTPDGRGIYFLSERNGGSMNVYRSDLNGGQITALTKFTGEPVRFLSRDNAGNLCFGYAGEIYTLTEGGAPQRVNISITHDVDDNLLDKISTKAGITSATVSPDGKQIAFISRGEVFVTSAEYTTTKRITSTPAAESSPTFSKDGRSLVYASCRDGAWDLYRAQIVRSDEANFPNATTIKEEKLIPEIAGEKTYPQFSPDGKEIAFVHERERLVVYNLTNKTLRRIMPDGLLQNGVGALDYQWSPDGKWFTLSYVARAHAPYSDIGIVRSDGRGEVINLTNSGYTNLRPRWVFDGNAIIYMTERYGMRNHASWGSMDDVMVIFLNRAAHEKYKMTEEERELLEEAEKSAKKDEPQPDKKSKKGNSKVAQPKATPSKEIHVELDGIEDRRVRLTPNSSNLADAIISPDGKKLYYLSAVEGKYDLWVLDLAKKTTKIANKLNAASSWFVDDKQGKNIFILGGTMQRLDPKTDALKAINHAAEVKIDYVAEREAMFDDVVREQGLRFYRADMHGVDWPALTSYYRRYLPHISNNYDFAEMLSEMLGELNVSHTGSGYRSPSARAAEPTAELGLFFASDSEADGLRVEEVVAGGPFDRSTSKLRAGDVIISIDGTPIKAGQDYFPLLNGKAGQNVLVAYRTARGVVEERVKPITAGALSALLYRRWVRQRAEMVERLSGGTLGYVHIPSMGDPSFREMYSEALGRYYGRQGIVIDIRHNGGGRLHEDIEVFFSSKKYLQQEVRGRDYCEMPSRRWNHASIMLVCEDDYSNAHGTPWVYKHLGIGKVVGMPVPGTMTSVNWVTLQDPTLYFGIPAVGYRTAEGTYLENAQLEPDVLVPLDPVKALGSVDTQLEAAVRILMQEIKSAQ